MPFKHHASRRHKFAKSKHRVTNWPEYTESLRRRGDVTVWVDESVAHDWGWRAPASVAGQGHTPSWRSRFVWSSGSFSICPCGKLRDITGVRPLAVPADEAGTGRSGLYHALAPSRRA
ncbi:hypothetical protein [Roseibium sp.]|uniref:hypothetical protein n=1 Tax=Roseibium sp. TaxID=1936156 RepID=UPI003267FD3A